MKVVGMIECADGHKMLMRIGLYSTPKGNGRDGQELNCTHFGYEVTTHSLFLPLQILY